MQTGAAHPSTRPLFSTCSRPTVSSWWDWGVGRWPSKTGLRRRLLTTSAMTEQGEMVGVDVEAELRPG